MDKFDTEIVNDIKAKEIVEQLVINGVKQMESFKNDLSDTTYLSEYRTMLRYIEHFADSNSLPGKKYKELAGVSDGIKEYEFKSKHIRIYAIQQPAKKIIIFLGYKNTQPRDIPAFRSLKKQFLNSLKENHGKK